LIFFGPGATQQFTIPYVSEATGRGHGACSWILACLYLSALVWGLLSGYTVRWLGARMAIVLGLGTYTAFCVCVWLCPGFWAILAAAALWGWGAAAVWISGPTRILESESALRRGRASGIFYSSVYLGQALGVLALGWVGRTYGRPAIFAAAACIGLCANAASLSLRAREAEPTQARLLDALRVFRGLRGMILCMILLASSLGFGIVLSPLTSAVNESKGFGHISSLLVWFYIGRVAVGWIAGWFTDRLGRIPVLTFSFLLGALGLGLAAASTASYALALAALGLGLQAGIVHIPVMALVGDWVEPERRHLAFGALYAWRNLGVSAAILFGQGMRTWLGGDRAAFAVFAGVLVMCGLVSAIVFRQSAEQPGGPTA